MTVDQPATTAAPGAPSRTRARSFSVDRAGGPGTPVGLVVLMIAGGGLGLWAAFQLTLEKLTVLANPEADLSCNFSVLVGCSTNLTSWQGSLFGFPNPLIGIVGWTIVSTAGVTIAAGTRPARWWWITVNIGLAAAVALVGFLIVQSIYVLGVLCPYCMLTWAVTIPLFWAVTLYNLRSGHIPVPRAVRRIASTAYDFVLLITTVSYLLIAILAQTRLDWISRIG